MELSKSSCSCTNLPREPSPPAGQGAGSARLVLLLPLSGGLRDRGLGLVDLAVQARHLRRAAALPRTRAQGTSVERVCWRERRSAKTAASSWSRDERALIDASVVDDCWLNLRSAANPNWRQKNEL